MSDVFCVRETVPMIGAKFKQKGLFQADEKAGCFLVHCYDEVKEEEKVPLCWFWYYC